MSYQTQLKKLQDDFFNGKQTALAKAIGKSAAQVNQWLNGYRNISDGMAIQIERTLGLPDNWMSSNADIPDISEGSNLKPNTTFIDYLDVSASCGLGEKAYYEYPEIVRQVELNNNFIESFFGSRDIRTIRIAGTSGDSMEPTIPKNSATFIDISRNSFTGDGIYLFFYRGEIYMKRLQKTPDGLLAISDNPFYKPFLISSEFINEFNIIAAYVGKFSVDLV